MQHVKVGNKKSIMKAAGLCMKKKEANGAVKDSRRAVPDSPNMQSKMYQLISLQNSTNCSWEFFKQMIITQNTDFFSLV